MGMPAVPAIAAARIQPVTPPMRMKSGMTRSQALRCSAFISSRGAVEILADLQRRFEFGSELGVAIEVVVDNRLLDPRQSEIVDHVAAKEGVGQVEPLVEVGHQLQVADRVAHGCNRRQILTRIGTAEA